MKDVDKEALKEFIRENLELVVNFEESFGRGNSQHVGIKFKDEDFCFTSVVIYVPYDF